MATHYDTWKLGLNDPYFDDDEEEAEFPPVYEDDRYNFRSTATGRFLPAETFWKRIEAWEKRVGWEAAIHGTAALKKKLKERNQK